MQRVILARLATLIDSWGSRAYYRVLAKGNGWTILLIRRDDRINPADWRRGPGE